MDKIKDFVANVLVGNNAEAKSVFNEMVSEISLERLNERKVEIAQSLFQTEESVEEGALGAALGSGAGAMLGGPVGAALGGYLGHKTGDMAPGLAKKTGRVLKKVAGIGGGAVVGGALGGPLGALGGGYLGHRMTKEQLEALDEISTRTLARAATAASDPEADYVYDKSHDPQKFADYAKKTKGPKAAANVQRAADGVGHFPRANHVSGRGDPLRDRDMRSTNPNMVTKAGKLTKGAQKGLKSSLTREEIESLDEKAKSPEQQNFMGMVYAAKKGMKPASPEVARAAAGMTTKQAREYAATKHAELPKQEGWFGGDDKTVPPPKPEPKQPPAAADKPNPTVGGAMDAMKNRQKMLQDI